MEKDREEALRLVRGIGDAIDQWLKDLARVREEIEETRRLLNRE